MVPRHQTLKNVWDEWHGLGLYHDCYGGIGGRDELYGAKWRSKKNNPNIDSQHYSRTKRSIEAIKKKQEQDNLQWIEDAINELEDLYQKKCKKSVAKFVLACQDMGLLPKKKPRGKQSPSKQSGSDDDMVTEDDI